MKKIVILFLLLPASYWADSPLTSTVFHPAYSEFPMVAQASKTGQLSTAMSQYLASPRTPLGVKAALVNALSWSPRGKNNASRFKAYLASRYKTSVQSLDLKKLNAHELMSLGYLTAMDDYFNPGAAVAMLALAKKKNKSSLTIAMVHALVKAQASMHSDWCRIWFLASSVANNHTLNNDLRKAAVDEIMKYMKLYQKHCQ